MKEYNNTKDLNDMSDILDLNASKKDKLRLISIVLNNAYYRGLIHGSEKTANLITKKLESI